MKILKNKNAIITGASRGIGRGIALEFAKQGCNVAFTYSKSVEQANKLIKEIESFNVKARGYQSDASSFSDSELLVSKVLEDFSGIDILINNAGITKDNLLMRLSEKDFDDVININLKSVFNMTKAVQKNFFKTAKGFSNSYEFCCWYKRKCWTI
jgi:3-oxoacyl-[acyl-carrier protein] reductase